MKKTNTTIIDVKAVCANDAIPTQSSFILRLALTKNIVTE